MDDKFDEILKALENLGALQKNSEKEDKLYLRRDAHTGTYIELFTESGLTYGQLKNVHSPSDCALRPCAIHDCPSGHPLSDAPLVWAVDLNGSEQYALYRECQHKQLHPDVDAGEYLKSIKQDHLLQHECDGCCKEEE